MKVIVSALQTYIFISGQHFQFVEIKMLDGDLDQYNLPW